jgi:D-ribulokinase
MRSGGAGRASSSLAGDGAGWDCWRMSEAFIGVDVGTGSVRAGVFDANGRLVASARQPIEIWQEPGGIFEHSSRDIWRAACAAVGAAVRASGLPREMFRGMSFDATCSLVVLDPSGASLPIGRSGDSARDVIVWMDHRAVGEADFINRDGHEVLRYVGGKISPEMQMPKLLWLAKHMPDTYRRAGHFLDLTDFLTWRATGAPARSVCTVTCKWTYLAHERRWSNDFFDRIGLPALGKENFTRIGSHVVEPGTPLGDGLGAEAADAMGLPQGLPVGAGLIDAHAGAVGTMGASLDRRVADRRRRLALILGTSACCMAVSDKPRFIDGVWGPYFSALTPHQWLNEGGQSAFGAAIDHIMRLHPAFPVFAKRAGEKAFEQMEGDIVARAGSLSGAVGLARELHVLPDLLGNRSPLADPNARGALIGLDLSEDYDSLLTLYVATLSGLAQGIGQIMRALERGGYEFDMLVVSGGAARSPLVRQTIADATGKKVGIPETPEPVLLGSAMLGAVAAGRHDVESAMSAMSRLAQEVTPAGGEAATLHEKKRRVFELSQKTERDARMIMQNG